jgi:hypothetical protein
MFDDFLAFLWRQGTLFRNYLTQDSVDFTSHVRSITTDIEISFLRQKFIDQGRVFA